MKMRCSLPPDNLTTVLNVRPMTLDYRWLFMFRLAHLHLLGPEIQDSLVSVVGGRWAPNTLLRAFRSNADAFERATRWASVEVCEL
jgi:hypothetical protein